MRCLMNCGGRKLKKRRRGLMAGMYVCAACGPQSPRSKAMAYRLGIPEDLWILMHRRSLDTRRPFEAVRAEMMPAYLAGKLDLEIAAERDRRIGRFECVDLETIEPPVHRGRPKVTWKSLPA